jgi:hypothetical protein
MKGIYIDPHTREIKHVTIPDVYDDQVRAIEKLIQGRYLCKVAQLKNNDIMIGDLAGVNLPGNLAFEVFGQYLPVFGRCLVIGADGIDTFTARSGIIDIKNSIRFCSKEETATLRRCFGKKNRYLAVDSLVV